MKEAGQWDGQRHQHEHHDTEDRCRPRRGQGQPAGPDFGRYPGLPGRWLRTHEGHATPGPFRVRYRSARTAYATADHQCGAEAEIFASWPLLGA